LTTLLLPSSLYLGFGIVGQQGPLGNATINQLFVNKKEEERSLKVVRAN
jgi:hypothetical protein